MKTTQNKVLLSMVLLSTSALAGCFEELELEGESSAALGPAIARGEAELARMKAYLADRYDAADVVHTFTQPSGDVIDCVRRDRQPGLRAAAARGRRAATPPPVSPSGAGAPVDGAGMEAFLVEGPRDEAGAERFCRGGTVPIRRLDLEDLTRFATLDERMRGPAAGERDLTMQRTGSTASAQFAVARQLGLPNQGAHAVINVWNPDVEVASEYSANRVQVRRGLQWINTGVQKHPARYGTWQPHLYIYYTSDGGATGCYDLECGRFVQVDHTVVIGGALSPVSVQGGAQYEIEAGWLLWEGNWWLGVNGTWVGYYAGAMFDAAGLASGADSLDFGGVIWDDRLAHKGRHTTTGMGSGMFHSAGWQHAAYQRELWYWTDPAHSHHLTGLTTYRTDSYCYDVSLSVTQAPSWHTYLFMGGPGYNANCL